MTRRRTSRNQLPPRRLARHGRHGRIGRSPIVRPPLPPLNGRLETFDIVASAAIEFLRGAWPELREVRLQVATMPHTEGPDGIPMWHLDHVNSRIVLFRVPIERLLVPGHDDAMHRRMAIEGATFRAAAEYVGREPWDYGDHHH